MRQLIAVIGGFNDYERKGKDVVIEEIEQEGKIFEKKNICKESDRRCRMRPELILEVGNL